MTIRRLSKTTWSLFTDGHVFTFRHNKLKYQLSIFEYDLIVAISSLQPVKIGLVNKHRHYWLYRDDVFTTPKDVDTNRIIKHNEKHQHESLDELTKLLLGQMKSSYKQYGDNHKKKMLEMKQQNQQLLKSLKKTHESTIKLLMKRTKNTRHSRYIPQDVKIQVVIRDNGMCRFPGCFVTKDLHFDHVHPYSKGGRSDEVDNIQLLCSMHNWKKASK